MTEIHGFADEKFAPVEEAFAANFENRDEIGASVAVSVEGEMVLDLWGGYRDGDRTEFWEEDTIVNVYSTTKTMAAMCVLLLADRGEVDLHAPVAKYWPEFAQNGKDKVQVCHFLSHSAGLAGLDEPITGDDIYDWHRVVDALARQTPWWEPGSASGYHAMTQGHLIGEVVRRVTGKTLGTYFREEIAEPLQADFHIGTAPENFHRIGELVSEGGTLSGQVGQGDSIAARTFRSFMPGPDGSGSAAWRMAEIPAANGHGNARSVVRVQSVIANLGSAFGVNLMTEAGCRRVFEEQTNGRDLVLGLPLRFGMGYGLNSELVPLGPNPNMAFWAGWGGSLVVVDQDARMCISYVMNRMATTLVGDLRGFSLLRAAYKSLAS
jgi:CubicO group peptidase (beta-lactamase class C family)